MLSRLSSARGASLLQAILVLLIAGLLIAGVWVTLATNMMNHKINQTAQGLATTFANIREFYQDRPMTDVATFDNAMLLNANVVSPELVLNGSIQHNLSDTGTGDITFAIDTGTCGTAPGFSVTLSNLGQEACGKFVLRFLGSTTIALGYGITGASLNGSTSGLGTGCGNDNTLQMCLAQN
jgi:hypothetical protein